MLSCACRRLHGRTRFLDRIAEFTGIRFCFNFCVRASLRLFLRSVGLPGTPFANFCKFVILDNCASDRVSGGRRRRAFRNRLIYFMYQQYNSVTFFLQDAYYESNAAVWNCLMPLQRNVAGFLAGREGDHVWIRIEWKIRWMRERFRFT